MFSLSVLDKETEPLYNIKGKSRNKKIMPNFFVAKHLKEPERIRNGAFYTPPGIVSEVYKLIKPFLTYNSVIFDPAGGCGSFILPLLNSPIEYRIAEKDKKAVQILKKYFKKEWIVETNSLLNVSRRKFYIDENRHLIIVGNPPYNDTTSEYRKGQKGKIICDKDLYDRDTGISFLKMFDKIRADVVCILHPLSYLIKQTNFNRLKGFRENYKLLNAIVFPSTEFRFTSRSSCFPVVIALYIRGEGMSYEYIKDFNFRLFNSSDVFCLNKYVTVDGYINKYPPRKNDELRISPIGVYYYSFRDLNSLLRNASFTTIKYNNSVVVTVENLYKYCYLFSLKTLWKKLNVKHKWIFGNLSPLVDVDFVEKNKELFVSYALHLSPILSRLPEAVITEIKNLYHISSLCVSDIENKLISYFESIYSI